MASDVVTTGVPGGIAAPATPPKRGGARRLLRLALGIALALVGISSAAGTWWWQQAAIDTALSARTLTGEGWSQWRAGRLIEARDRFQEAVRRDATWAAAWNGLGWTRLRLDDPEGAERAFRECLKLDAAHPAALNGLGKVHFDRGQLQEAELAWLEAAPQAPAAWWGLARLCLLQERYAEAAVWASKALADQPQDEIAKSMLRAARDRSLGNDLRRELEPRRIRPRG